MSTIPQLPGNSNYAPRLIAKLEGVEIPAWDISVGLSGYGTADTVALTTFWYGLRDYLSFSALQQSQIFAQKNKPMRLTVEVQTDPNGLLSPLFRGFLDIINVNGEADTCEMTGRGVLSLLLDQHITVKLRNNQRVEQSIAEVVRRYGLNPVITAESGKTVTKALVALDASARVDMQPSAGAGPDSGVTSGKAAKGDAEVTSARNMTAMGYITSLANAVGWNIRIRGTDVIIGPPPAPGAGLVINKVWETNSGALKMKIQHAAYHSHTIHVKIVSYVQGTKGRVKHVTQQGPTAAALGLPAPVSKTDANGNPMTPSQGPTAGALGMPSPVGGTKKGRGTGTRGGRMTGYANVPASPSTRNEMYVYHIPGLTKEKAQAMADKLRDDLSRREFLVTLEWAPDAAEAMTLARAGSEYNVALSGIDDPVVNGAYTPKLTTWKWTLQTGLVITGEFANHPLPEENNDGTV